MGGNAYLYKLWRGDTGGSLSQQDVTQRDIVEVANCRDRLEDVTELLNPDKRSGLLQQIDTLTGELDRQEQHSRRNNAIIYDMSKKENKTPL